jgi:hypothetical protein
MAQFFVGHATIEGWATAIEADRQVYALMTVESRPGQLSRVARHIITLAQPVDGEVHYFRLPVGLTEWIGNTCVSDNPKHDTRVAHANQAWELIKLWLKEAGLIWMEAAVAVPEDLRDGLLEGEAEWMGYDRERGYSIHARPGKKVEFVFDERSEVKEPMYRSVIVVTPNNRLAPRELDSHLTLVGSKDTLCGEHDDGLYTLFVDDPCVRPTTCKKCEELLEDAS